MDKAILIDKRPNGEALRQYLAANAKELGELPLLDRQAVLSGRGNFDKVTCLFATWHMPTLSEQEIADHFPALKAVFYAAGDTSYFASVYERRGVKVFNAQLENSIPVAEYALGQILLANKGYFQSQAAYRRGFWRWGFRSGRAHAERRPGNFGARVGIIGMGAIGTLLAGLLKPFELDVVVSDPFVGDEKVRELSAKRVSTEELFDTSDVISNHLPDIPDTRGILNYGLFARMKPNATFINTGRGRQVDEAGLARAMRECPSRAALLDVTRREPPDPHSPLYRTRNIFLSPHIAGSQSNEIQRLYGAALRQYLTFLNA